MTIDIAELKDVLKEVLSELKGTGSIEELLTTKELAERLKCPVSWVYSRTREKSADAIPRILMGKYQRFRWTAVCRWLEAQGKNRREIHD